MPVNPNDPNQYGGGNPQYPQYPQNPNPQYQPQPNPQYQPQPNPQYQQNPQSGEWLHQFSDPGAGAGVPNYTPGQFNPELVAKKQAQQLQQAQQNQVPQIQDFQEFQAQQNPYGQQAQPQYQAQPVMPPQPQGNPFVQSAYQQPAQPQYQAQPQPVPQPQQQAYQPQPVQPQAGAFQEVPMQGYQPAQQPQAYQPFSPVENDYEDDYEEDDYDQYEAAKKKKKLMAILIPTILAVIAALMMLFIFVVVPMLKKDDTPKKTKKTRDTDIETSEPDDTSDTDETDDTSETGDTMTTTPSDTAGPVPTDKLTPSTNKKVESVADISVDLLSDLKTHAKKSCDANMTNSPTVTVIQFQYLGAAVMTEESPKDPNDPGNIVYLFYQIIVQDKTGAYWQFFWFSGSDGVTTDGKIEHPASLRSNVQYECNGCFVIGSDSLEKAKTEAFGIQGYKLLDDKVDPSLIDPDLPGPGPTDPSDNPERAGFIFPDIDTVEIPDEDIKKLSDDDIRMAINDICALHGVKFSKAENQKRYSQYAWYKPTISMDDFNGNPGKYITNATEKKNFDKLVAERQKRGGNGA